MGFLRQFRPTRHAVRSDSDPRAVLLARNCTALVVCFLGTTLMPPDRGRGLPSAPARRRSCYAAAGSSGGPSSVGLPDCGGMIVLDAAPTIVRVRAAPLIFILYETVECPPA